MDREILFRGKRLDNKKWVYGYLICCAGRQFIVDQSNPTALRSFTTHHCDRYDWRSVEITPSTVGQYTGKTVKTGKVFQDDIGTSIDGIFLVVWDDESAAFMMQFYDYPEERLYLDDMWDDAEIIGNIHDNPELIGGEDDG